MQKYFAPLSRKTCFTLLCQGLGLILSLSCINFRTRGCRIEGPGGGILEKLARASVVDSFLAFLS